MPGSIDLSDLATNLGGYCRENADTIFSDMLLGLEESLSRSGVTVLDNIKDEFILPNLMVGDLVKPGDYTTFTPGDDKIKFDNRTLKVRPFKVDLKIYPQQFEATWLTHLRKSKGTYTADNFPFYEFLMGKIVEKIKAELRKSIWKGVYNAGGTNWIDICDGFLKKITDDVTAGDIIEVTTGVVTSANAVASIEATVKGLGDEYQDRPGKCIVSPTIFDWYIKTDGTTLGRYIGFNELSAGTNQGGQAKVIIRGTNIELVKETALGTSQRIIAVTDENLFMGTDTVNDYNTIRVQEFERSIKLMVDGKIGAEYALANSTYRPISVNDQA